MPLYPKIYGLHALLFGRLLALLGCLLAVSSAALLGLWLADRLNLFLFASLSAFAIGTVALLLYQVARATTEVLFRAGFWHLGGAFRLLASPLVAIGAILTWSSVTLLFYRANPSNELSLVVALMPLMTAVLLGLVVSALGLVYTHIVYASRQQTITGWSQRLSRVEGLFDKGELRRIHEYLDMEKGIVASPYSFLRAGYPELPSMPFHSFDKLPWMVHLESQFSVIQKELIAMTEVEGALERDPGWFRYTKKFLMAALRVDGKWLDLAEKHCPKTVEILKDSPSPFIAISVLLPGGALPNHIDFATPTLVYQLGVRIPDACEVRVGSQTRRWVEGESIVFDNCYEHEVRNDSDSPRIVLLADTLHPGLSEMERRFFLNQV